MSNKRKAQDVAGGNKKKSKMPEPPVARWPALPVDTFGWKTNLPTKRTLYKTLALAQYRLQESDLKGLVYDTKPHKNNTGYMHMYKEHEVEWVAWQVHGGPDGLWHLLKRLQEEYDPGDSDEPFPCPWEYTPGQQFDLALPFPPLADRYLMGNAHLRAAKAEFPPWFWAECNLALNRALAKGALPSGERGSASKERVYAMAAARQFFARHAKRYVGRPEEPLQLGGAQARSLALPTFRALLSNAPAISANLRDTPAWGPEKARLRFCAGNYEWDDEYLGKVFRQLGGLVKELSPRLGDDVWKSLAWEVYHKYAHSVDGGLRYDARRRCWTDPAGIWLEGRIVPEPAPDSMRGRCADGRKYNALLPVVDEPGARTPSPGPGPGGSAMSNTPSPVTVRAPVAGPSSA